MLDLNLLRTDYERISKRIRDRNRQYQQLDDFLTVDNEWKKIATTVQELNTRRNVLSEQVGEAIKSGNKTKAEEIKEQVKQIKNEVETLEDTQREVYAKLREVLFSIPNIPDESVPVGKDENDNVELRKFGKAPNFDFSPLPHWDIATKLNIADFERAVKLSGSRHTVFINDGAKLLRALRNFTLDLHAEAGFNEVQPPVILNAEPLYGTGNLPKYEEDLFKLNNGQYLSPTEEIPLTALYMNETLNYNSLPIKLTSSTLNFRSEVGSAGRDQKGIIRQYQFYNTEMIIFSKPNESESLHEEMTHEAEKVLQELGLSYRVILLCTGDMGASAVKTYDIEVWLPSYNTYKEISSCSNTRDYQARGLSIKYSDGKEKGFVHTLNGTGTSLNRLWAAVVENYQQADGTIKIPEVLRKYMNNQEFIK